MSVRNYSSTAAQTTLASGVDASATTLAVSATTGFPAAPFILAVDAGASSQELVLVTNVAGTNLTVTRGYDSTVAVAHDTGAVVAHSHGAIDFREANAHVNAASGAHGVSGAVVGTSDAQTLTNKTVALGGNTVSGTKSQFDAALMDGDFVFADSSAFPWQTYTPTWSATGGAPSLGNGSISGRYVQIGKTVHYYIALSAGSTTTFGSGRWDFTLPIAPIAYADGFTILGRALARDVGVRNYGLDAVFTAPNRVHCWRDAGATEATATPTTPHTWATGDYLIIFGSYEAA